MCENQAGQTEQKGKSIFKRWWFWAIIVVVIIIIASSGNPGDQTNAPATSGQTSDQSTPAPKQDDSIRTGMYKIGQDLPAGEYVIISNSSSGYFQLLKDSSGQLDTIISNDIFDNRSIVTVMDGEYFELRGSKAYPVDKAPKVEPQNGTLQSGMYKVGLDLEPGEYKVTSSGDGYIEVANDSRHTLTGIISNDIFSGDKYVTIQSGQYIKLQKAELILK